MSLFSNDLGERLLSSFNSTGRDALSDLGQDQDEQDRIVLNASKSVAPVDLRVDYSDFSNHIFFNSAYTSVNLAYSRILNDYPSDGTYKDYFEWRRINNGYENWFFDNYPKQQGYIFLTSGSNGPSVYLKDYENKFNLLSSNTLTCSITFEFITKPYENLQTLNPVCSVQNDVQDSGYLVYFENKNSSKFLTIRANDSGSNHVVHFSASCDSYISSSNHFAVVATNGTPASPLSISVFANGVRIASGTAAGAFNAIDSSQSNVRIGYFKSGTVDCYFSGAIDEFRLWNTDRSNFIAKNYFKPIYANPSGGLKLYYKFNETQSYGNQIIDYSGNELHGQFSGNYSLATTRASGTLGAWFKDGGDPIFDSANSRVVSFFTDQQNSGSLFDQTNRNYIFKIVPSFFVDNEDSDNQKLFLLLLARHYDKLKLYIEHLANIHNINLNSSDDTPDRLMNLVAQNYGVDITDVYETSDPLQLYFGEGVLGSGSLDSSVEVVKNQLKRNVLNNLIYFIKTKSTRETLESILRSLGIDSDTININEYSLFSGGITTIRTPTVTECRVANFNTSSIINITSSVLAGARGKITQQIRFLHNTASAILTSSIIQWQVSGNQYFNLFSTRENATSTSGSVGLTFLDSGSVPRTISSSLLQIYNNQWTSVAIQSYISSSNNSALSGVGFFVSQLDYDTLINSASIFTSSLIKDPQAFPDILLGSSGTNYFSGAMQEYRIWTMPISNSIDLVQKWHYDYNSTEVNNFNTDIGLLLLRYKLNDFTSSTTSNGVVHDYISGFTSSYSGFTTSSQYNFPGMFIPRYVQSYSYDINTSNDKIRLRDQGRKLNPSEQTFDVPMVTADISPVTSLNKEIINYFGNLSKFNNIIGQPYNKYRTNIKSLNQYKSSFFEKRINSKIDFKAYINLIKWLDSNFTILLNQFIPLDMISSLSNYTIEPGIFDFNKVKYPFPYYTNNAPTTISCSITTRARMSASSAISINYGDPGRFGAAVSASANIPSSFALFTASTISSSAGVNFHRRPQRDIIYLSMSNNYNNVGLSSSYYSGSNNSFFTKMLSSSNHNRNILNINTDFYLSASKTQYQFTGTFAPLGFVFYTGSLNAVQDQKWMWEKRMPNLIRNYMWDIGIGYGAGWGQTYNVSQKSYQQITGNLGLITNQFDNKYIKYYDSESNTKKTVIIWPADGSPYGTNLYNKAGTTVFENGNPAQSFGAIIDIEGYQSLTIEILGNYSFLIPAASKTSVASDFPKSEYYFQFQFFDKEFAETGFETIASGSIWLSGTNNNSLTYYQTEMVPHLVYLYDTDGLQTFHLSYKRPIPANKYMRIQLTPVILSNIYSNSFSYVNLLVKGILSKEPISQVDVFKSTRYI